MLAGVRTVFKSTDTRAPRLVASAVMGQLTTSVGYCGYCLSDAASWTVLGVQEAAGLPLGAVCFSMALMAGARYTLRAMLNEARLDPEEGLLHVKHHSLWGVKPMEVPVSELQYVGQAIKSKDISIKLKSGLEFIGPELYLAESDEHALRFLHRLTQDEQLMRSYMAELARPPERLMDVGAPEEKGDVAEEVLQADPEVLQRRANQRHGSRRNRKKGRAQ